MLAFGLLVGVFSYSILFAGLLGKLNFTIIFLFTIIFCLLSLAILVQRLKKFKFPKINIYEKILTALIGLNFLIVFLGTISPELSFDALWYHLTIPKIFLTESKVFFIPGNLFYYSLMPKLIDMLFVPSLLFWNEIGAKITHFAFYVLTSVVTFKIARVYLKRSWALLCVVVFQSNLVVMWLATTAYIDLGRAFYEVLAIFYFIKFYKNSDRKYLLISAVLFGFAISSKLISLATLPVYLTLIFIKNKNKIESVKNIVFFTLASLSICVPYFLISFYYTGNPIYPIFSSGSSFSLQANSLNPFNISITLKEIFLFPSDPISPIYIMVLPILFFGFKSLYQKYNLLILFTIFSLISILFINFISSLHGVSTNDGARFITSYLPIYSVLVIVLISQIRKKALLKFMITVVISLSFISLGYRFIAQNRFYPVILGLQSKNDFLMKNLNFNFGDFYDNNDEIMNIVGDRLVLIHNGHNLYYANFNYTLPEWVNSNSAEYELIQNGEFKNKKAIYTNPVTKVSLYKL